MLLSLLYHYVRAQYAFRHLRGAGLKRYQDRRARRLVRYAVDRAPFYRDHWAGQNLDNWQHLPTVDKRLMMEHFDTFNTLGISKERAMETALAAERSRDFAPMVKGVTVGLSSGTSGHRGLFLVSPAETAAWAGTVIARVLHGIPAAGYRIAFFLRSNSNLYEKIGASKRLQFRWFDLMTPIKEAVAALNAYQPRLLVGPPSLLRLLGEARRKGGLTITPERLVSVAETLEPQDKTRLETTFEVPVHTVYQCTEGFLAASCSHGTLHVNADLVALQYEPVTPDEPERVTPLVTDLWRRTQPILRYRLGDVLRMSPQSCACGSGFPALAGIEGRSDDVLRFISQEGAERIFFPDTIRRMVLLAGTGIADYAAEQERPGHLRLYLEPEAGADFPILYTAVEASVQRVLIQYGCRPTALEIRSGLPARKPDAKRRRVRNLAPRPENG